MGWQYTTPSRRLSAQTCHRQLCRRYRGGTNRSTLVWLGVVIHDALFRKRGEHFQYPFRKDKVIYGDLPFGGQDGQPGRGALRCGRFGLSELFPDAQRLRRGAARLHPQTGPCLAGGVPAANGSPGMAGQGKTLERRGGSGENQGQPPCAGICRRAAHRAVTPAADRTSARIYPGAVRR